MQKRRRVSEDNPNKLDQLFPNRPWSKCKFSQVLQVSEPDCTHSELTKIGSNANACKVRCKICKATIYDERIQKTIHLAWRTTKSSCGG